MPIKLEFSPEKHIITLVWTDPWSLNDLDQIYEAERHFFDEASGYKVHTLVDVRNMHTVPPRALTRRQSPNVTHPNSGRIAIVGASAFVGSLASAGFKITGYDRAKFFATLEDAQAYLEAPT